MRERSPQNVRASLEKWLQHYKLWIEGRKNEKHLITSPDRYKQESNEEQWLHFVGLMVWSTELAEGMTFRDAFYHWSDVMVLTETVVLFLWLVSVVPKIWNQTEKPLKSFRKDFAATREGIKKKKTSTTLGFGRSLLACHLWLSS